MKIKVNISYEYDVQPEYYVSETGKRLEGVELADRVLDWDFSEDAYGEFMWDHSPEVVATAVEGDRTYGTWTNRIEETP